MDPVLNRKLFSDRSARRRLAEMGGIMASSPALMNEVRTFQTGGPISDVLGRQAPAAGASFEETTARTARQLVREAQRRLASRDIEGARELLVYAAQLGSPEAQQLLSSPALGQPASRPMAPGSEAGPAQPIGQQIGDLLRGALQPVGGALRETMQPIGELGREIGAPVGEALRETMQPIGEQMPRFVLGLDSAGVRPGISAVSQPSLPSAPAITLPPDLGPMPAIPGPVGMPSESSYNPADMTAAEILAASGRPIGGTPLEAARQALLAEAAAPESAAANVPLPGARRVGRGRNQNQNPIGVEGFVERIVEALPGAAANPRRPNRPPPPPSLTPETGVGRFDVPVGPGLPAARPRVYDAPIGPNPAKVVTDLANTFGETGDPGAATDTALQAYGITPADNLKGRVKQYQDLFKELLGESDEDKAQEMWLNLAMVGFAIASGTSPNALENISAGLLQGSQRMAESRATRREREDRMTTFAISSAMDEAAEERAARRSEAALEAELKRREKERAAEAKADLEREGRKLLADLTLVAARAGFPSYAAYAEYTKANPPTAAQASSWFESDAGKAIMEIISNEISGTGVTPDTAIKNLDNIAPGLSTFVQQQFSASMSAGQRAGEDQLSNLAPGSTVRNPQTGERFKIGPNGELVKVEQ